MSEGIRTIIYPVKNISQARALYGTLAGVKPEMDQPYYVQFSIGGQQIGLDPNGHSQGMTGPVAYWHVDDIKKMIAKLVDAGAKVHQEVKDVGGGKLIGSVKDTDGNVIALLQNP